MKFSHRRLEISVRKFCIRHFYYFISFLFGVTSITFFLIGGGLAYNFFSTGVRTNQVKIEVLEKQTAALEQKADDLVIDTRVIENAIQGWKAEAKAGNDLRREQELNDILEQLRKNRR